MIFSALHCNNIYNKYSPKYSFFITDRQTKYWAIREAQKLQVRLICFESCNHLRDTGEVWFALINSIVEEQKKINKCVSLLYYKFDSNC